MPNKNTSILLPASKSISNRVLIIQALCGGKFTIHNLSKADDTRIMQEALNDKNPEKHLANAGTAMRFLTAYFAQSDKDVILQGSDRMNQRPIAPLVEALQSLGDDIEYLGNDGFPPLKIKGQKLQGGKLKISSQISSQFISALMLIAPTLKEGLTIEFDSQPVSLPYIKMTAEIMEYFGVKTEITSKQISIPYQQYIPHDYSVESDWSSASYFYALCAIKPECSLSFPNLFQNSIQGDSIIKDIMQDFGVETIFEGNLCKIKPVPFLKPNRISMDMLNYPDLIPTLVCLCVATQTPFHITGTSTLQYKESNRAVALQTEIKKLGIEVIMKIDSLSCNDYSQLKINNPLMLRTYDDHRLVMAFSILSAQYLDKITLENPQSVIKSFPGFFEEMGKMSE